jgi:siroheme synthase-like protein
MPALFPLFLKLEGRRCVLVGAGRIALQKIDGLLEAGAHVDVVALNAAERIQQLAGEGRVRWIVARFAPEYLDGAALVIAATGDPEVNDYVFRAARERGILCNSVDEPQRCDFYYPSVVRRGDLQIAISTAGKSPVLAQRIRRELEQQFDQRYARWLEWLGAVRALYFQRHVQPERRTQALHRIASGRVYQSFSDWQRRREAGGRHG